MRKLFTVTFNDCLRILTYLWYINIASVFAITPRIKLVTNSLLLSINDQNDALLGHKRDRMIIRNIKNVKMSLT